MDDVQILDAWTEFFRSRERKSGIDSDYYIGVVARLTERGFPPILDLTHLAKLVGVSPALLASQAAVPERYYRSFEIAKRSGGVRQVDAPLPTLMATQRWILENILENIETHDAAHGFVVGRSVISNARQHCGVKRILKLDLKDFFPSIRLRRGIAIFIRAGYPAAVSYLLARLCFLADALPQGAPTSPYISNIAAKRMDARLAGLAEKYEMEYSRYADDIAISGSSINNSLLLAADKIARSEGFYLNIKKTRYMTAGRKMIVAGVSLSSGVPKLPKAAVRAIKQDCHFILRYGVESHFDRTGSRDPIVVERLIGKLGFWLQIEPENGTALRLMKSLREFGSASPDLFGNTLPG